jgi:hypothetical protein
MKTLLASLALMLVVTGASAQTSPPAPGERTLVNDPAALTRLQRNSGITLQWISFEQPGRGHVVVTDRAGLVHLQGSQTQNAGAGRVDLEGDVLSISPRSFTFRGRIMIENSPDPDRECLREGTYEFRATGTRRYWRLQYVEACDGLADYVDIYF